jgi:phosphoribosylformylglycinamidine synthase
VIRGVPPALDLDREAALQRLLVSLAADSLAASAHDCAEGGLAVAIAECCFDSGLGAVVDVPGVDLDAAAGVPPAMSDIATLFGESASRVVVSVAEDRAAELLERAKTGGVPAAVIGRVGGEAVRLSVDGRMVVDESRVELEREWATALDARFERGRTLET